MNRNINILFIYRSYSSFVKVDQEILKPHFNVKTFQFTEDKIDIFKLLWGVLWSDITISWFAVRHAFYAVRFSKMLRKKSIVIVGGYEVAKVPEINYGLARNQKQINRVRWTIENADTVLTVDDGLKNDAIRNIGVNGENIQNLPTGYDYNLFKPHGEKKDLVLTVSVGNSWERILLKGLNTFVEAAKLFENVEFLVIGIQGDALEKLREIASSNVTFIEEVSQSMLIPYYQKAKVYCQLSMREGLPNALCEAMSCECVPVGTDVQGIRTAIGDTGFYVPYGDPEATAIAIKKALESDKGKDARERIKKMFPIERREKELIGVIQEMMDNI
jgi:glycosyltransferase involved in cell wall biosynthesis